MYRSGFPKTLRYNSDLLIVLYLLLKLKNVKAVAAQLHLTPPAVSQKLSRLREIFNDPLLVRSKKGMILTTLSEVLLPSLESIVLKIESFYNISEYYNNTIIPLKREYVLSVNADTHFYEDIGFLDACVQESGGDLDVSFSILLRDDNSIHDLLSAKLDFYFGNVNVLEDNLTRIKVSDLEYSFAVGKHHPLAGKKIKLSSIDELNEFKYIALLSLPEKLEEKYNDVFGREPFRPFIKIQSIRTIADFLNRSDYFPFLTVRSINKLGLSRVYVGTESIFLQQYLYWHKNMENDSFHRYLRNSFIETLSKKDV